MLAQALECGSPTPVREVTCGGELAILRPKPRLTSGLAKCLFLLTPWFLATECYAQGCSVTTAASGHPLYTLTGVDIGYQGNGYVKTGLVAPEAIPLGVRLTDEDTIFFYCDAKCYEYPVPTSWTANWQVSNDSGGMTGKFLSPTATLVSQVVDASHVLYIPPTLASASSNTTLVKAFIVDACQIPGFAEAALYVQITVTTTRRTDGKYDITAVQSTGNAPQEPAPLCLTAQTVCENLHWWDPSSPPSVSISAYPGIGMVLGETRMIKCDAEDIDLLNAECGTPEGYDPPSGVYDYQEYCDALQYDWSVLNSTGTGMGQFLFEGRSAIFRATAAGSIRIQVKVTGVNCGAEQVNIADFTIYEPKVKSLKYNVTQRIQRDKTNTAYDVPTNPHWLDMDNDGTAADSNERRIPVAYVRNEKVRINKVVLDCTTNAPTVGVIKGVGPGTGADQQVFLAGNGTDASALIDEMLFLNLTASVALPNTVKSYESYFVLWQVSFGDDLFFPLNTTDNYLYATLEANTPLAPMNYPKYESLFHIACEAANSLSDPAQVNTAIWNKLKSLSVKRKPRDGFNLVDDQVLKYHAFQPSPTTLAGLMMDPDGDGECLSFAQLMRACYQIQGLDGGAIWQATPPGSTWMMVYEWTVNGGGSTNLAIGTDIVEAWGVGA